MLTTRIRQIPNKALVDWLKIGYRRWMPQRIRLRHLLNIVLVVFSARFAVLSGPVGILRSACRLTMDGMSGHLPTFQGDPQAAASGPSAVDQQDELKTCIQNLVRYLDNSQTPTFGIASLSRQFKIKRRRLYDILNVFEAIGFCHKTDLDKLEWKGRDNLESAIRAISADPMIYNPSIKLADIFPCPCSVGVSSLAICFLKMFFALSTTRIDLRPVSQFLSRDTMRYRTTLCKMYQIAYILTAIDVTSRTTQVCVVALNSPYSDAIKEPAPPDPTSLLILLNRQGEGDPKNMFQRRRDELNESAALFVEK